MVTILAVACAVVYGIADYCGGRAARNAPSVYVSFVGQLASLVMISTAVLFVGTAFPGSHDVLWGAAAGVASGIALTSFYHALSHGAMAVVAPITAVTSAVIPVAVGLFDGERPSGLAYLGMGLAVAAVALVSGTVGTGHDATRAATIAFALIAGLGFAFIFIALHRTSEASGLWPLVSSRIVSITMIGAFAVAVGTSLRGRGPVWRLAVASGVLDMAANVLYLLAVRRGLLSVVVVIVALYPVSTVCLAFGLDRERVTRSQGIGMVLAVAALVLVSIAGP